MLTTAPQLTTQHTTTTLPSNDHFVTQGCSPLEVALGWVSLLLVCSFRRFRGLLYIHTYIAGYRYRYVVVLCMWMECAFPLVTRSQ
jgi:hypothetical protein